MANNEEQINNTETTIENEVSLNNSRSIVGNRNVRIGEINDELKKISHSDVSEDTIEQKRADQEAKYQEQIAEFNGLELSNVSREEIYKKMVDDIIDSAQAENKRFDDLIKEKEGLVLYNNLELGENAEEQIAKARELITKKDESGDKIAIFNQALAYYSKEGGKIADIPIYHGTGSFQLSKILENGALDSSKNIFGGEKNTTNITHGGTSFAIDGYDQTEFVSHLYASMNEKTPRLVIDRKKILENYSSQGEEAVETIFGESKLNQKEREFMDAELKKSSIENIIKLYNTQKYYFDYEKIIGELKELEEKNKIRDQITDKEFIDYLDKTISLLKGKKKWYDEEISDKDKELLEDPFSAVLVYDGKGLPKKDLETLTTGGICERRTNKPISNSDIKQIRVPYAELDVVKKWIENRIQELPENSKERQALESVEIIPIEFFEIKKIVQNQ